MSSIVGKHTGAATVHLLASYLDEHLHLRQRVPPAAQLVVALAFHVGPFRFLCRADALQSHLDDEPCAMAIDAARLVPATYRAHLARRPADGLDVLRLKGGRLEIRGCRRDGEIAIPPEALVLRGPRADAPWICATTRDPPAFVLDADAAQLHFMRRARQPDSLLAR